MSKSAAAEAPAIVKVLWMDDKPNAIREYARSLESEGARIEIEIATSIEVARAKLQTNFNEYDGLVVDCKMDDEDETVNGAEFLAEINETQKAFPTFVYSGFWSDLPYKRYVTESYAIKVEYRKIFDAPLSEDEFFKKIYEAGSRYLKVKGFKPEEIQYKDYIKKPSKYANVVSAHRKKHGHWVRLEMERKNWVWSVVCGESIVKGDADIFKLPTSDELKEIGHDQNRIPYIYSDPLPVESIMPQSQNVVWSRTKYVEDYYPTLKAKLGKDFVIDDFDTGATQTVVSSSLVNIDPETDIWDESSLHNISYQFVKKQVDLTIMSSGGMERTARIPVMVVNGWDTSPFRLVNGSRKILFGRDVLRAFKLEICLDSDKRITRIKFI